MIAIILFIFLTFLVSYLFKKSFGKVLPISFMLVPVILYCSQFLFQTFSIGIYLTILASFCGFGLTIYKAIKKDKEYFHLIFSQGFFVFLFLLLFLFVIDYQKEFSEWDELAHWGMMIKEMLRLDKFYAVSESLMIWHKDYPPFLSLFEYFWCYLLGYSEEVATISLHTYMLGLLIPYLVDTIKKKWVTILSIPIFVCSILMFDPYQIFKSIQTDLVISIEVSFALLFVFFEKEDSLFKKIVLSLSVTSILLTKQIGIPFAFLVLVYYFLDEVSKEKSILKKKKFWLSNILIWALPFLLFFSWNIYTSLLKTGAQFSLSNINIKEYLNIVFLHQGLSYKLTAFSLFQKYLWTEPVLIKPFPLGYIPCSFLLLSLLLLIYFRNKKEFDRKKLIVLLFIFTCGTIGYAFTMSVLYLFCFSESETVTLACFGRYMSSYVLIEFSFLIGLLLYFWSKKNQDWWKTILLCLFLVLFMNSNLKGLLPQKENNYVEWKRIASEVNQNTEENSKLFFIIEDHSYSFLLPYFLESRILCKEYDSLYSNVDTYEKEKVVEVLMNQDYLYIDEIPEGFQEKYGSFFESEMTPKTLYKINKEQKKIMKKEEKR